MTRAIIALVLLLSSCYKKSDAVAQLRALGRPEPITCVRLNGRSDEVQGSFACIDGERRNWLCDQEDCIPGAAR